MQKSPLRLGIWLSLAALTAGSVLASGDAPQSPPPNEPPVSGLVASLTPGHRELREPTERDIAELRAQLEEMIAEALEGLLPKSGGVAEHPNGGRYFTVPGHLVDTLFVLAGPDGSYGPGCADLGQLPEVLATRTAESPARTGAESSPRAPVR